ncbi:MAG: hypothetical protein V1674_00525 [Candidatus Omnitrophota bacterium]
MILKTNFIYECKQMVTDVADKNNPFESLPDGEAGAKICMHRKIFNYFS